MLFPHVFPLYNYLLSRRSFVTSGHEIEHLSKNMSETNTTFYYQL